MSLGPTFHVIVMLSAVSSTQERQIIVTVRVIFVEHEPLSIFCKLIEKKVCILINFDQNINLTTHFYTPCVRRLFVYNSINTILIFHLT